MDEIMARNARRPPRLQRSTSGEAVVDAAAFDSLPRTLCRDLRSDHAGECGAVAIYDGMLAVTRDATVRSFAREHRETEARHLAFFEQRLPRRWRTRARPVWRAAGWLIGALGALGGRRGAFLTVEAVERFVVDHYQRQIDALAGDAGAAGLRAQLMRFQSDEAHHRDEAWSRHGRAPGWGGRAWQALIGAVSSAGVVLARWL